MHFDLYYCIAFMNYQTVYENALSQMESGIASKNINSIRGALYGLERLYKDQSMTDKQRDMLSVSIVRAYTAMCLYDQENGLGYMKVAMTYREDASIHNNIAYILHTRHGVMYESLNHYMMGLVLDSSFDKIYSGAMAVADSLSLPYLRLALAKMSTDCVKDNAELLNGLGLAQLAVPNKDYITRARQSFDRALVLSKSSEMRAKIYLNLGHLYSVIGDTKESVEMYIKCIQTPDHSTMSYSNLLLNLHYNKRLPKQYKGMTLEEVHEMLMKNAYPPKSGEGNKWQFYKENRNEFKVGIITADLIGHAVSCFIQFLLKQEEYPLTLYSNAILNPMQVETLKPHVYRCIHETPVSDVVNMMIRDGCTHIIDLSGHTSGNRMDVLALLSRYLSGYFKLFTYCGYPNSVGFKNVRRITDSMSEPVGVDNSQNTLLDRFFLCYTPHPVYFNIAPKVHSKNPSMITLGSFCKLSKINQHMIDLWVRVLKRYPQVRLVLKHKTFADDAMRIKWKTRFGAYSNRIQFLEATDSSDKHMELYRVLDLHLDTYPYSGTTITHECLFMNVPVLTLCKPNDSHVSQVSSSLLRHIGLTECVAVSEDDYVQRVGELIPQLHEINVRQRLMESKLMDKEDMLGHFIHTIMTTQPFDKKCINRTSHYER